MDVSTIVYGIIFAIVNPWAFFELRRTAGARAERMRRARDEVVDLLESRLTSEKTLPPQTVHELCFALAQKRDVKIEEIYKPINIAHELMLRVSSDPVIPTSERADYVAAVRVLISGLLRSEGVKLVDDAIAATKQSGSMVDRSLAKALLTQLAEQWTTFEDQGSMKRLRYIRTRLGSPTQRETALRILNELKLEWSVEAAASP